MQTRRHFLYTATGATGMIALGTAFLGLNRTTGRTADVIAQEKAEAPIQFDVSGMSLGDEQVVVIYNRPVIIRRRHPWEVERARRVSVEDLVDPYARTQNNPEQSATDQARSVEEDGEWFVVIARCPRLGCVVIRAEDGWYCPCGGASYDTSGRIYKGPIDRNLAIPRARFVSSGNLEIDQARHIRI